MLLVFSALKFILKGSDFIPKSFGRSVIISLFKNVYTPPSSGLPDTILEFLTTQAGLTPLSPPTVPLLFSRPSILIMPDAKERSLNGALIHHQYGLDSDRLLSLPSWLATASAVG